MPRRGVTGYRLLLHPAGLPKDLESAIVENFKVGSGTYSMIQAQENDPKLI